jgi:hypothetical protein
LCLCGVFLLWCVSELSLCVSEYIRYTLWTALTNYYVRFLIRGSSAKNESSSTLSVRFTLVF